MDLLERFKRQVPRWESPDPGVRAEGVREDVRVEQHELLSRIAVEDPDPRVRKAAVRKLTRPSDLATACHDADEGVREAALELLLALARGSDESVAHEALAALSDPRHLAGVAREGNVATVRLDAVARLGDRRQLSLLARLAEDAAVRSAALERLDDEALIVEVAIRGQHKATVVQAVDRVGDAEALATIARRAAHKSAARRAKARLEELAPPPAPPPPVEPVEADEPAAIGEAPGEVAEATSVEADAPGAETVMPNPAGPPELDEPVPQTPAAPEETQTMPTPEGPLASAGAEDAPVSAEDVSAVATAEGPAPEKDHEAEERERRQRAEQAEALASRLDELVKIEGLALRDAEGALREARGLLGMALPGRLEHRLRAARSALFARAQELREADEWTRWANAAIQEELCQILESLKDASDLERLARDLRRADQRWAAARLAPRDQAEALRQRYQAARAVVKERLEGYFAKKAETQAEHLKEKLALCERAEALADSTEWLKVAQELQELQKRWKAIGGAAPRDERTAWKRFHGACDRFFTRRQADLRRQKETWAQNLTRKEDLCVRAEALADSSDWEKAASEIRRLQAEWKEVGPVRRSQSEAVWARFRKACDAFFDRYKKRDQLEASAKRADREALCLEMEQLVPEGSEAPEDLAARVTALMTRARQAAALPVAAEEELTRRLVAARNRLVELHPTRFHGTELDPEANRARREKLCARVEALAAAVAEEPEAPLTGEALARRLKEALASNTIGGRAEAEARKKAERAEVELARSSWKRLGPVPGEVGAALEARFNAACARYFGEQRAARALTTR